MSEDNILLDFTMVSKILRQLINSDGMEVTNRYLIEQKIYYIDNVGLIEDLEHIVMEHFYNLILDERGYVNLDELLDKYTPQYINYDKYYNELERKYNHVAEDMVTDKPERDNTLNKYFLGGNNN